MPKKQLVKTTKRTGGLWSTTLGLDECKASSGTLGAGARDLHVLAEQSPPKLVSVLSLHQNRSKHRFDGGPDGVLGERAGRRAALPLFLGQL